MMRKRPTIMMLLALTATVCPTLARAQRGGGLVFAPAGRMPGPILRHGLVTHPVGTHRVRRHLYAYGFAPYFYSDYEPENFDTPPPEIMAAPPAPVVSQPAKPAESVLLELRGDRWVRITNFGASADGEAGRAEPRGGVSSPARNMPAGVPERASEIGPSAPALPKASLVFRDGHKEEIPKYVIVGRTLFTSGDYWSTGSWTRKVEISELDVPATLKLNQQRGTKFSLPSGPTEVMMRP